MIKEELKTVTNEELIDELNHYGHGSYYMEYRADIVAEIKKRMRERCSDVISRQEAIRLAEQGQVQGFEWQIKKLITLQSVVPIRKKGKWENGNPICPCCGEDKFKDLDADIWADWQPKFCPNCGSEMEREV